MLNFKELDKDGIKFELLIREILFTKGIDVHWSGIGPDGGRDLLCVEKTVSPFGNSNRRWLVQCKHFAHSQRSVGIGDLDSISDSVIQHQADGYVLACSTYLSSAVMNRLESLSIGPQRIYTGYMDSNTIERELMTPQCASVAQRFFPVSANATMWQVHYTERPNHFIINYKGYVFHIINRIDSDLNVHFHSIKHRIEDIEAIPFVEGHFLRPRCFWYNGKSPEYIVHLDYMIPYGEDPQYNCKTLERSLGDGDVLEDGQYYTIDIQPRRYIPHSDHYHPDHYDYYVPYIGSFLVGEKRERLTIPSSDVDFWSGDPEPIISANSKLVDAGASAPYERFLSNIKREFGSQLVHAENAVPEVLEYSKGGDISSIYEYIGGTVQKISTATFVFRGAAREKVFKLIEKLDQDILCAVSCREGWTFVPSETGRCERSFDGEHDRLVFLEITATFGRSAKEIRDTLNKFFASMSERLGN